MVQYPAFANVGPAVYFLLEGLRVPMYVPILSLVYTTILTFSLSPCTISSFIPSSTSTSHVALTYRPASHALSCAVSQTTNPPPNSGVSFRSTHQLLAQSSPYPLLCSPSCTSQIPSRQEANPRPKKGKEKRWKRKIRTHSL